MLKLDELRNQHVVQVSEAPNLCNGLFQHKSFKKIGNFSIKSPKVDSLHFVYLCTPQKNPIPTTIYIW